PASSPSGADGSSSGKNVESSGKNGTSSGNSGTGAPRSTGTASRLPPDPVRGEGAPGSSRARRPAGSSGSRPVTKRTKRAASRAPPDGASPSRAASMRGSSRPSMAEKNGDGTEAASSLTVCGGDGAQRLCAMP